MSVTREHISFRIDVDLLDDIDRLLELANSAGHGSAIYKQLSRSDIIRAALEAGVSALQKQLG